MSTLVTLMLLVIAVQHLLFLVLEMFLWTHPIGLKTFRQTPESAEASKVLAANQGLYNGFLAAGLAWAAVGGRQDVALFFLGCVLVAGIYGGLTAKRSILVVQGLPAAFGIAAVLVG